MYNNICYLHIYYLSYVDNIEYHIKINSINVGSYAFFKTITLGVVIAITPGNQINLIITNTNMIYGVFNVSTSFKYTFNTRNILNELIFFLLLNSWVYIR